ncbi:MAG TPA: hypothetical protein VGI70_03040, partial [Polyangiales bacterium]
MQARALRAAQLLWSPYSASSAAIEQAPSCVQSVVAYAWHAFASSCGVVASIGQALGSLHPAADGGGPQR